MLTYLAQIPLIELRHQDNPMSFAIKEMAEIEEEHEGGIEPPHRHSFYAIMWHKAGEGTHIVDFVHYELKPNQIYFLAPGQVHQVIPKTKSEGWVLVFTRDFIEQQGFSWSQFAQLGLFDACQQMPPLLLTSADEDRLEPIMLAIRQEFILESPEANAVLVSLLRIVMIFCFRLKQDQQPALDSSIAITEVTSSRQQQTVQLFTAMVESKHHQLHQVGQYAELLNVSSGYLNVLIKSHTGRTAKDVIMDRLLLAAKREALFTARSSKEVAFGLGFDDPAHFSKFFKTATDITFMTYRQQLRAGNI